MFVLFHILFILFIGSSHKKTVYIDSPLLKTEMTVRERSHIYHEESLKRSIKKNGSKNVFHLMTELPVNELNPSPVINLLLIVVFCFCLFGLISPEQLFFFFQIRNPP